MMQITINKKTRKAKWYEVLLIYLMAPFLVLGIIGLLVLVFLGLFVAMGAILIGVVILLIFLIPVIIIINLIDRR